MHQPFHLVAGHVALDFANTLDNRFSGDHQLELLQSYEDLLQFVSQAELFNPSVVRALRRAAGTSQSEVLALAIDLRETLFAVFTALAQGSAVKKELKPLNRYLSDVLRHRRLRSDRGTFVWVWNCPEDHPESPLWPITLAAADLLASTGRSLVRECRCDTCRWLFLDTSKNHSRQWCDMKLCGNRSKARRFYQRHAG